MTKSTSKKTTTNSSGKKSKSKGGGPRPFPKNSLEEALKIPLLLKEKNGGNPWSPEEVINALNIGKGNRFYYLTASSRDYGLTEGTRDSKLISLNTTGKKIVYASSKNEELEGYKEAFFNVEVFKKVFEYYDNGNLPELVYLKNTLKTTFKIDEGYHDDFYNIFTKNTAFLKKHNLIDESQPIGNSTASKASKRSSIVVGEPSKKLKGIAFVAMPFTEKTEIYPYGYFDEVLKHLITPAAVEAGFKVETARKQGSDLIQSTIINDLINADLVICDLTDHNPNVLFELGIRISTELPVALIKSKNTSPIFDVDHLLRVYSYSPNLWKSTLDEDVPNLTAHIKGAWENRDKDRSYLNILKATKTT
tara:strand:- start:3496 stop:4584 length:1089 start_codon:yes stop_codon:yes gene_type:complete